MADRPSKPIDVWQEAALRYERGAKRDGYNIERTTDAAGCMYRAGRALLAAYQLQAESLEEHRQRIAHLETEVGELRRIRRPDETSPGHGARPRDEWHEDDGNVLWWRFPIVEAPYVGSPLGSDWEEHELEGHFTHWTPIPIPSSPEEPAGALPPAFQSLLDLEPNWDSYGAKRINLACVQKAYEIWKRLAGTWLPVPHSDGTVGLEQHQGGFDIEIDVDLVLPPLKASEAQMAMLPNDHHPGRGCSCRECLRQWPEKAEPCLLLHDFDPIAWICKRCGQRQPPL
jgi:hypothetical protein